jgi:3-dehydroquinate dehydratase/shikimate dehydrogenase
MVTIAAIIARQRHESLIDEMHHAVDRGAKLLEIRLDYVKSGPRLSQILSARRVPLIATVRRREDGGKWADTEERRLQLLRAAIAEGFDYVDLEDDIAASIPRFGSTRRLISHHDMEGMPKGLSELHAKLAGLDADVVKIAARASKATDNFKMLRLVQQSSLPTIALAMGEYGLPSRVLAGKVGSPFTYAAFNPDRIVAPGLLSFDDMRDLYNVETTSPTTRVLGVIGDPIAHSLSPQVHNAALHATKIDAVYVPWRVSEKNLPKFLDKLDVVGIEGLSVTIPHKEAILARGVADDKLVQRAASANTIRRQPDGTLRLNNTDGPAAMSSLEAHLSPHADGTRSIAGRSVLVLGAGGVVRTIACCLHDSGAIVTLTSRTASKAQALAQAVGCKFVDWAQRHSVSADIVINGTPVGMHPAVDESPYHAGSMKEGMIFFDTVYNPMMTQMLKDAAHRGAATLTGVDMFIAQAEAQFQLFNNTLPPAGMMKELVLEELSPAKKMLREARLARRRSS